MKKIFLALAVIFSLSAPAPSFAKVLSGDTLYRVCQLDGLLMCSLYIRGMVEGQALLGLDYVERMKDSTTFLQAHERYGSLSESELRVVEQYNDTFKFVILGNSIYCIPEDEPIKSISRKIFNYLDENPDERHKPAVFLVSVAIRQLYPCPMD